MGYSIQGCTTIYYFDVPVDYLSLLKDKAEYKGYIKEELISYEGLYTTQSEIEAFMDIPKLDKVYFEKDKDLESRILQE